MLRLPELDDGAIPGAGLVRRAVRLTLGMALLLALAAATAVSLVTFDVTVDAAGTLEPVRVWPVRSRVGGTVAEVLVAAGDTVRVGQPLVQLDTLGAALALDQLEAQVAGQRIESERVRRVAVIERRQGEAALAQGAARVLRARATLRQRMAEFSLGSDVDSVLAAYRRGTHVALDAVIADLEATLGDVDAARAQLARATLVPLDAARQRFEARRLAAQVAERRAALSWAVVAAPAEGVVLTEQTEQVLGTAVREGETVLEIADIGTWRAAVAVREGDVYRVRAGDKAMVEIPAVAALRDEPVRARVVSVASEPLGEVGGRAAAERARFGTTSGGYRVVLALDRAQVDSLGIAAVRRGYGVRAKIVTRRARAAVLVREWLRERLRGKSA